MTEPEEIHFISRGLRVAGRAWGRPEGFPVLALHGWLDNANSFARLAPLLSHCRVVALDMPGHGWSQHRSADSEYHFVDWVTDVAAALEFLRWPTCVLMGHSMGAAVACLAAGTLPDRVNRLILIDGLGPLSSEASETPTRLATHIREQVRLTKRSTPAYKSLDDMAAMLARVVPLLSLEGARILLERGAVRGDNGKFGWTADPRLRGTSVLRLTEAQCLAFLHRISCPTLLLRAIDGYPMIDAQVLGRKQAIARLTTHEMTGGHHVHLEHPEKVADCVRRFLAEQA